MQKDFWRNSKVVVLGGGSFGSVMANTFAQNCQEVRLWVRKEEDARAINATRTNPSHLPDMRLHERVHAMSALERVFEHEIGMVVCALPSEVCRSQAKAIAPFLKGREIVLHATKGIEQGTLKRVSEILCEEWPIRRVGVISGPNLAGELAKGEPAATVIASRFDEVIEAGRALLTTERFRTYGEKDVVGVEWSGTLKNILAIASGALDGMKLGWNARAMLITRGLAEMVRFGVRMGANPATFLGLAGAGDLLATCSSPLSRNYRVGLKLAQGQKLADVIAELGSTAEGVRTTRTVWEYSLKHGIEMPITGGVFELLNDRHSVQEILHALMTRPNASH